MNFKSWIQNIQLVLKARFGSGITSREGSRLIQSEFVPLLRQLGFRGTGNKYRKTVAEDVIWEVYIQPSQVNSVQPGYDFYVNLCVQTNRPSDLDIRTGRLDKFSNKAGSYIWELSGNLGKDHETLRILRERFQESGITWLTDTQSKLGFSRTIDSKKE